MEWLNNLQQQAMGFDFTSMMGVWLYWVPMLVCLVGEALAIITLARRDVKHRSEGEYTYSPQYRPQLTVGRIIWLMILTFTPVVNIGRALFLHASGIVEKIYNFLHGFLSIPIIPDGVDFQQKRDERVRLEKEKEERLREEERKRNARG